MKKDDQKLHKVMAALQADESFLNCVLEMIDTVDDKKHKLKTGDDAEEAVVSIIQNAGNTLLRKWMLKKNEEANNLALADDSIRPHEKKRSAGIPLSET